MTEREKISKFQRFIETMKNGYMGIVSGEMLQNFFVRQQSLIFYLFALGLLYICMVFTCGDQRARISQLEKDVKVAYYRHMAVETELTEMSRQSVVENMLHERKLSIHESDHPAIIIK